MSRIEERFAALKASGRCALIPYIVAGDPRPGATVDLLHTLVDAGADIIELGVPFSDPMADGSVIQAAHERALAHHVSLSGALDMVAQFRQQDGQTPVLLMGYANPMARMGYEKFAGRAAAAGVDGVLTVDLPPEEGQALNDLLRENSLDSIFLLAPTTTTARIQRIVDAANGFLYYVSLKGVTGAGNLDVASVEEKLNIIRTMTKLPIAVGFGINSAQSAADISGFADAVVIGSALVKLIGTAHSNKASINEELFQMIHTMRLAVDNARGISAQMEPV